ncbi:TIGR04206 family protein [Halorientalis pallida]|uniref:TIGR04206 family protein n=1 Tax=Halorientalis pallida TaxID=2479928 RepID=UPI003C6FA560
MAGDDGGERRHDDTRDEAQELPEPVPDTVRRYRRLPVLIAVAVAPWNAVLTDGYLSLFFTFGIVNFDPAGFALLTDYYFRFSAARPEYMNAWGLGVLLFAVGLLSALAGLVWREDQRVTAAMFVFAGFGQLVFALGFLGRPGPYVAIPFGTILLWGLVWRYYRSDLASIFRY